MRQHLEAGLIPFWVTRAADRALGGYRTNFNERGEALPQPDKYLNTQCRLLWWFARLSRAHPDQPEFRALADHGYDFIFNAFWDELHGGWFWKVKPDGSRLDEGKVVYGQSFALYALAEYALTAGNPRVLQLAEQTFDLLQTQAADTRHGGYLENFDPDWTPSAPGFHAGDRKSLDTHMHLMESFTALYAASQRPLHRRKLLEIVDLIAARMIDPDTGCGLNQFDLAWRPIPAIAIRRTWNAERSGEAPAEPTETTSYGHNTELAWLMRLALATAGADPAPYLPALRRLVTHALTHGVDWEHGGLFRDGLRGGGPLVLEKEFWQHAECLVGFLDAYQADGDPRCLDALECVWDFVDRHMIVHAIGEWRILLDRHGQPLHTDVGNAWKVSYHTGRAMLECVSRVSRLLG
jgi:mannobiose 2-epimerase